MSLLALLSSARSHNLCAQCVLRTGIVPPALGLELLAQSPLPSDGAAGPCSACLGLLCGNATLSVREVSSATGSSCIAANSWGGPRNAAKTTLGVQAAPAEVGDLVASAVRLVRTSGFDLRDGLAIHIELPKEIQCAEAAVRKAFVEALAGASPGAGGAGQQLQGGLPAVELREALRLALVSGLEGIQYVGLPPDAQVLTVEEACSVIAAASGGPAAQAALKQGPLQPLSPDSPPLSSMWNHPALAALVQNFSTQPSPDPRVLLAAASEACEAAFTSMQPPSPLPPVLKVKVVGGVEMVRIVGGEDGSNGSSSSGSSYFGGDAGASGGRACASSTPSPGEIVLRTDNTWVAMCAGPSSRGTVTTGGVMAFQKGQGGLMPSAAAVAPGPSPAPPPSTVLNCKVYLSSQQESPSLVLNVKIGVRGTSLGLVRSAVYVKGRYCKYLRGLSQTPWFLDGARKALGSGEPVPAPGGSAGSSSGSVGAPAGAALEEALTSVEEKLGEPIARAFSGSTAQGCAMAVHGGLPEQQLQPPLFTFHAAGREDVDVRMLGGGRPFMIELNACRPALAPLSVFERARCEIGGACSAMLLAPALKSELAYLAVGSEGKLKRYCALVWTSAPLTSQAHLNALLAPLAAPTGLSISQPTPVRVLHRRSLLSRTRRVFAGAGLRLAPHFFLLHLGTSAGTYVKEFVHGDLGRTRPCLADVMWGEAAAEDCDILFLDVAGHEEGTGLEGLEGEEGEGEEE